MNRIKTSIKGFDKLVENGIPQGFKILLSGTPGTGKTIFGLEYLYNGALDGQKGMYVTFEEPTENIINQAKQFNFDIKSLIKKDKLKLKYIPSRSITNSTLKDIIDIVKREKITRLVIDSITTLALSIPTISVKVTDITSFSVKRFIHQFIEELRELKDTTVLLISQPNNDKNLSSDSVSEYMADGIIHIVYESLGGEFSRSLIIRKLRQTKHDEDIHPLEISKTGLVVHSLD